MIRTATPALAFAAAMLASPLEGQTGEAMQERFELFNQCRPIRVLVEGLPESAGTTGLGKEDVQAVAESRLRGARLYTFPGSGGAYRHINVSVVDGAFSLSLEYRRWVLDPVDDTSGSAATWHKGSIRTSIDGGHILSGVSHMLDEFLADYMRVNESHCVL